MNIYIGRDSYEEFPDGHKSYKFEIEIILEKDDSLKSNDLYGYIKAYEQHNKAIEQARKSLLIAWLDERIKIEFASAEDLLTHKDPVDDGESLKRKARGWAFREVKEHIEPMIADEPQKASGTICHETIDFELPQTFTFSIGMKHFDAITCDKDGKFTISTGLAEAIKKKLDMLVELPLFGRSAEGNLVFTDEFAEAIKAKIMPVEKIIHEEKEQDGFRESSVEDANSEPKTNENIIKLFEIDKLLKKYKNDTISYPVLIASLDKILYESTTADH